MQTGSQLHYLFITILKDCSLAQPEVLWEQSKEHICDDLKYALNGKGIQDPTDHQVYDYGLYLIEQLLKLKGSTLADFHPMPLPQENWAEQFGNDLIMEQQDYDRVEQGKLAQDHILLFNTDQCAAYDQIMQAVETQSGQCFFQNGAGGTGKTFIYNTFCYAVRAQAKIVLCVASSGIASLLLIGGCTAHSDSRSP
jgi:PIF1-like helicase